MKRFPLWILGSLLVAGTAQAQSDQAQLVRPAGAADLNNNLARLASNPRDVSALIGAGEAALALDDPRAAAGFFARADAIESGNGRIKAGLGRVMLQMQNPAEALRLFDQAGRLGYPDATILSDRGLARDMAGDQAGAQRDYQAALKARPNDDELVRRYAASLGISGQVDAAERILQPLLYKSDRAAWRYRAFIFAMNNQQGEAKKIADQTMPTQLAAAIVPYMRKMPYLTGAQKAAAVHFGHFPATIGTSIAAIVPTPPAPGGAPAAAPTQIAQAATTTPAKTRRERRSRREAQSRTRLAQADVARPARQVAPTPAPAPVPAPEQAARAPVPATVQSIPVPPQRSVEPQPQRVEPTPVPRPVAPQPAPPSGMSAVQTPAPVPPVREAAATPPSSAVQGPPAPGFESVETAVPAVPAVPPRTAEPTAGSQINAITLAQAAAPSAAVAQPGAAPAQVQAVPAESPPAPSSPVLVAEAAPTPVAPAPVPGQTPQPDPQATRTLADIIRAIDVPEAERQPVAGAVDLTELEAMQAARKAERLSERQVAAEKAKKAAAAKAKAEADAKAKKDAEEKALLAANPARSWLQIATGGSRDALGFTLKAMRRKYVDIAMQKPWVARWGQTNRLLVGPFANFKRAKEMEQSLKAAGADVFAWQSDAGEVVERLAAK